MTTQDQNDGQNDNRGIGQPNPFSREAAAPGDGLGQDSPATPVDPQPQWDAYPPAPPIPSYGSQQPTPPESNSYEANPYESNSSGANPYASTPYPATPYGANPYSGGYPGMPPATHPQAVVALVLGILGLVTCIPLIGIAALPLGLKVRREVQTNPQLYGGGSMGTAAMILGIVDCLYSVVWVLFLVAGFSGALD